MSREKQIEEMRDFMLEKSNSANVEPVFTTSKGKEIVLGQDLTKLLNDVLEQAFIPFLAKALVEEGYRKQSEWISVEERLPTDRELVLVSSMNLLTKKHGWFYLARYTDTMNNGVSFDEKRWVGEEGGLFGRVTHWMALPEAPKMKGGAE